MLFITAISEGVRLQRRNRRLSGCDGGDGDGLHRSASKLKMTTFNRQVRQIGGFDLGPALCKLLIGDTAHSRRLGTKFSLTLKFNQHSISNNKRGNKKQGKEQSQQSLTMVRFQLDRSLRFL